MTYLLIPTATTHSIYKIPHYIVKSMQNKK